ncbi:MAG TPA: hypothetical protein VMG12_19285, partial [Polyangiaceae bacterium]|nr:hypothetical protein [Polyangiaceae bacterium]
MNEAGAADIGQRGGHSGVTDDDLEGSAARQAARGRDDELAGFARPLRAAAVHLDGCDLEAVEIEVEARQALRRAC